MESGCRLQLGELFWTTSYHIISSGEMETGPVLISEHRQDPLCLSCHLQCGGAMARSSEEERRSQRKIRQCTPNWQQTYAHSMLVSSLIVSLASVVGHFSLLHLKCFPCIWIYIWDARKSFKAGFKILFKKHVEYICYCPVFIYAFCRAALWHKA